MFVSMTVTHPGLSGEAVSSPIITRSAFGISKSLFPAP